MFSYLNMMKTYLIKLLTGITYDFKTLQLLNLGLDSFYDEDKGLLKCIIGILTAIGKLVKQYIDIRKGNQEIRRSIKRILKTKKYFCKLGQKMSSYAKKLPRSIYNQKENELKMKLQRTPTHLQKYLKYKPKQCQARILLTFQDRTRSFKKPILGYRRLIRKRNNNKQGKSRTDPTYDRQRKPVFNSSPIMLVTANL